MQNYMFIIHESLTMKHENIDSVCFFCEELVHQAYDYPTWICATKKEEQAYGNGEEDIREIKVKIKKQSVVQNDIVILNI